MAACDNPGLLLYRNCILVQQTILCKQLITFSCRGHVKKVGLELLKQDFLSYD